MSKRRIFLKQTATLAAGSLLLPNFANASLFRKEHAIGLQLFTFFNTIDDDVMGTLHKIAEVGYVEIESAFSKKGGFYGMKPGEFNQTLQGLGLRWKSHHVLGAPFKLPAGAKMPNGADGKPLVIPPMKNLKENMQEIVDNAAEGKIEYLVCANTPIESLEEIKSSIDVLNKTEEACRKAGIKFAYHNHDREFTKVEEKIPYQLLLSETNVRMELDLAWATKGGQDPVALFKQHPGRFPLWHVKDLDASMNTILPVGEGTINYKRIFEAASLAGMQHFFVEHDMPKDAMSSIKSSYQYMRNVLKV